MPEPAAVNRRVAGSSPTWGAIGFRGRIQCASGFSGSALFMYCEGKCLVKEMFFHEFCAQLDAENVKR